MIDEVELDQTKPPAATVHDSSGLRVRDLRSIPTSSSASPATGGCSWTQVQNVLTGPTTTPEADSIVLPSEGPHCRVSVRHLSGGRVRPPREVVGQTSLPQVCCSR